MRICSLIFCLIVLAGCSDDDERYEEITKLRTLGVSSDKVTTTTSTDSITETVTLTFHLALPNGETVTSIENYSDSTDDPRYLSVPLAVDTSLESYSERGGFTIYSVPAVLTIPDLSQNAVFLAAGLYSLRYGLTITSDSGENENIVGNYLIYPPGSKELTDWQTPPNLSITSLSDGETVNISTKIPLKGEISKTIEENYRVGWFVSKGKVKNRRSIDTEWEIEEAGTHTIVLTIRGRSSGTFAYQAIDVVVQ